jgi:hypothetical protein
MGQYLCGPEGYRGFNDMGRPKMHLLNQRLFTEVMRKSATPEQKEKNGVKEILKTQKIVVGSKPSYFSFLTKDVANLHSPHNQNMFYVFAVIESEGKKYASRESNDIMTGAEDATEYSFNLPDELAGREVDLTIYSSPVEFTQQIFIDKEK